MKANYPKYVRGDYHFYKIVSENYYLEAYKGFDEGRIQSHGILSEFPFPDSIECTESEFLDAYNEVRNKLEELATK